MVYARRPGKPDVRERIQVPSFMLQAPASNGSVRGGIRIWFPTSITYILEAGRFEESSDAGRRWPRPDIRCCYHSGPLTGKTFLVTFLTASGKDSEQPE